MAQEHLAANGYKIIKTNYRNFFGEIDIIAYKKLVLVFIEVKSSNFSCFKAAEKITPEKCQRIFRIARLFIHHQKNKYKKFAFEVICVNLKNKKLNHFTREFFDF
ncbi:YraN family protein [Candidatus Uabimicrobium sp. HlEnr_7]|uniref:YraN family protein n=1 Tax=Candidatus Uabimicrobium helgolandensis TaxID=3095367 RepID=UPI003555DB9C